MVTLYRKFYPYSHKESWGFEISWINIYLHLFIFKNYYSYEDDR
uniref:Uncharacterized protein n=1 Tax=Anguilla anguilla TaxID=7936 RepID=A0A0E9SY25_ANGAN